MKINSRENLALITVISQYSAEEWKRHKKKGEEDTQNQRTYYPDRSVFNFRYINYDCLYMSPIDFWRTL